MHSAGWIIAAMLAGGAGHDGLMMAHVPVHRGALCQVSGPAKLIDRLGGEAAICAAIMAQIGPRDEMSLSVSVRSDHSIAATVQLGRAAPLAEQEVVVSGRPSGKTELDRLGAALAQQIAEQTRRE